jgi:hypothetical protein
MRERVKVGTIYDMSTWRVSQVPVRGARPEAKAANLYGNGGSKMVLSVSDLELEGTDLKETGNTEVS